MHSFPSPVEPVLTLVKYRYLIRQLVKKELTTKFRRSSLGFLWIVLSPLLLLGGYTIVFGVLMKARWG